MVSMTLALMTVLPSRRVIVAAAVAGLAAPLARVLPVEAAAPALALPVSRPPGTASAARPSPFLAALDDHCSALLAVTQAVTDYVRPRGRRPDEPLMLAIADRAASEETAALNALLALTRPTSPRPPPSRAASPRRQSNSTGWTCSSGSSPSWRAHGLRPGRCPPPPPPHRHARVHLAGARCPQLLPRAGLSPRRAPRCPQTSPCPARSRNGRLSPPFGRIPPSCAPSAS